MRWTVLPAAVLCTGAPLLAQPRVINGRVAARPAAEFSRLAGEAGPGWIGYEVAGRVGEQQSCDPGSRAAGPVKLEGSRELMILFRVEQGRIGRIRVYSPSCELDLGGLTLSWLTGMGPAASIRQLTGLLNEDRRIADGALFALSAHDDPAAAEALIEAAKNHPNGHVRGQALFWLAHAAGAKAAGAIGNAIDNDPDTQVKKRAVFALYNLPAEEGVPRLIEVAKANRNPEVRKQAMFWLGQSKDPRAIRFFEMVLLGR